ncbi:Hypothetical predicted protein [Lynx pardinus]|uniref:Uncharacterized protein n=1 Tax=Lynx pardinus TaxID=191816 RepID=A0A485P2E2_LYNPA|nr:Hypothetical predicted protein [Lynx pardinus]
MAIIISKSTAIMISEHLTPTGAEKRRQAVNVASLPRGHLATSARPLRPGNHEPQAAEPSMRLRRA